MERGHQSAKHGGYGPYLAVSIIRDLKLWLWRAEEISR
jgi:hypothetical protein